MIQVSIIMGVYNCSSRLTLLEKCINSIINQTYTEWELIVCDDGSTDDTYEILHKFQKRDSRIKLIKNDINCGLAYTLNKCITIANGKYIARQDDDDFSYSTRLITQIDFLKNNSHYSFVGSIADIYDAAGVYGQLYVNEKPQIRDFLWNSPFIHPSVMFRKEALEAVGGYRVAKETNRCEDYDLFMRLYEKNIYGYNIQDKLYGYYSERSLTKIYRPFSIRVNEAIVRAKGFHRLNLFPIGYVFIIKPLVLSLFPAIIMSFIKKLKYKY
ncbi:MAG: glycosyltransferase family 2 protein [Butyrivibrio sp.]|nr:glycosyltransferase family 2 protein [Butyrivibrio sp.]